MMARFIFPFSMPVIRNAVRFGQEPDDSDRERGLKAMATIVVLATLTISVSYFLVPGRSMFLHVFDAIMVGIELNALLWFWCSRSVQVFFKAHVPAYLCLMAIFVTWNGSKEGDIFTFMAVPCAAAVVFGPKGSLPWFWACFAFILTLVFIDPFLPNISLKSAVSLTNPEGSIFHSPWKKSVGPVEGIALTGVSTLIYFMFRSAHQQLTLAREKVELEKAKVDRLMATIYPPGIADQLKEKTTDVIANHVINASILFADLEGFTQFSARQPPEALVMFLDQLFCEFDRLADLHGVEKIKTMGDGYLAASGLHVQTPDQTQALCRFGADMIKAVENLALHHQQKLGLRVGLHTGPVVAGVIGRKRPHFDIWGGTVNMAHRLQATAPRNSIQISQETLPLIQNNFDFQARGQVEMKGLGHVSCWSFTPSETLI